MTCRENHHIGLMIINLFDTFSKPNHLLLIWHASYQDTPADLTLNHLFHCAYNLFTANKDKKSGKVPSGSPHVTKIPPESSIDTKECQTGMCKCNLPSKCMLRLVCLLPFFFPDE